MTDHATSSTEGSPHAKWLRQAAAEIAGEGYDGWSNTCLQAADEIERLDREYLSALERLGVLQVQAGIRQQGVVYTKADVESLIAVALAADRARRSPEPRDQHASGWVVEGAWSPTNQPDYWVGSSAWSTDPYKALRFATQQSALQAAEMMCSGVNIRICAHEWAEQPLTKVEKP